MAYLPVVSLSRSQSIRLGRGVGNSVAPQLPLGDLAINPQTGALNTIYYANLNDPQVRRDLSHHATLGGLLAVGMLTTAHSSDLYAQTAPTVSAGTGLTVDVTSFPLIGRTYGGIINVPAQTNLPVVANDTGATRTDAVVVNSAGQVEVVQGAPNEAGANEVDTVTIAGAPTGGSFLIQGTYAGTPFTTAQIPYDATATQVADAVASAANYDATTVGTGGPLPAAAVTLTTPNIGLSGLSASSFLTGGTAATVSIAQTSVGAAASPYVGGEVQVVATFTVPAAATAIGTVTSVIPTS